MDVTISRFLTDINIRRLHTGVNISRFLMNVSIADVLEGWKRREDDYQRSLGRVLSQGDNKPEKKPNLNISEPVLVSPNLKRNLTNNFQSQFL
jgi:hypothetical protein